MRTPINLLAPTFKNRHLTSIGQQELTNFYLQEAPNTGVFRQNIAACGMPGTDLFLNLTGTESRCAISHKGLGYVVVNDKLYKLTPSGTSATSALLGTLSTTTGQMTVDATDTEIVFCDRTKIYRVTAATGAFADITSNITAIDGTYVPIAVMAINGRFIYLLGQSNKVLFSALLAAATISALSIFQVNSGFGELTTGRTTPWYQYYLTTKTTEIWYDAGQAVVPFQRVDGGQLPIGIAARDSAVYIMDTIYFLGQNADGLMGVVAVTGTKFEVISNYDLLKNIQEFVSYSDAIGSTDVHDGHVFYNITFPNAESTPGAGYNKGQTFTYDLKSKNWINRPTYNPDKLRYDRHIANCHMFFNNQQIIGDFRSGKLYSISTNYFDDDGQPLLGRIITPHFMDADKFLSIYNIELDFERGVGLDGSGQGSSPQIMMRISKDKGHTWSQEYWRALTKLGVYNKRVRWSSIGGGRTLTLELTITDPIRRVIAGGTAEVESLET